MAQIPNTTKIYASIEQKASNVSKYRNEPEP
jgi:hypothetical protein